ncbi:hypothetical protein SELMODRAFT_133588 [Selaginella moellendorffii]|uniref:Uncharacterized protein n=1 Tax=Selaginella moellendorffii TaxID=88036 RepID=D8T7E1_SELML|nr:protein RETICULATA-RELATED 2, chloroplastic [Selaginella moellendorffii]EFJ07447.1 hypothetical protein SELMODRAFT_133588 [Selaginella moellendorffii]|eukprot:XP_002991525.1 protein RETICULATA-RELATED 2, chloroplastic [Selaginella moellendorffii]
MAAAATAAVAAAATGRENRRDRHPHFGCGPRFPALIQRQHIHCRSTSDAGSNSSSSDGARSGSRFRGPVSLFTFREEPYVESGGGGGAGQNGRRGGGGGGGGGGPSPPGRRRGGIFGAFLQGWEDRVRADPQFPFKVAMEEIVGVGANVLGDMASRPNFGLNELDFVFSTMVVGSLLNFTLMYLLAPTGSSSGGGALPGIFSSCPPGHMFESGNFSLAARAGTFLYKGAVFAAVGFAAGLVGTALSSLLLAARKRMDPSFQPQNKAPPTVLNAATWAAHMGLSSNLRYQAVNGLEFGLAGMLPPALFKASVLATRTVNNLLGGYTFVALARLTGSQKSGAPAVQMEEINSHEQ